ncbi:hypothetical protein PPACK8108_LOCUS4125 [Phakopsora pachyrhizi]|uniref:Uncharacterized protein n=1 Tax=Phakopsora pachyrhizi TaxID=170000 RepID=A0AAV0AN70_PHAPC|nr:hypothetical protein PPACK8108_LOCUS4125 [Phakopsora pachyrhizi]
MINKTALINQHIYEIEKLRHDLIVTQTKNGLYLSEDRGAEIRHKSESKSGNLVDSRRKIEKEMDCFGSIKTGGVAHKTQSPETGYKTEGAVAGQCYSSRIYISKMEPQPRLSVPQPSNSQEALKKLDERQKMDVSTDYCKLFTVLEFSGEKRVSLTNPVVVVVGAPVLEEELSWSLQSHSPIDFETSDDDEVIARGPPMLLTKTEQARELSKSSEQIKCEARVRVRGDILSS